jgi:SAM-dependent methyltransferase
MNEYDRIDATYYDLYSTGLEGDVEFYVQQARDAGGPVLEIGCGTGRILIPTAEAGVEVTGLDNSQSMLAVARNKIAGLEPGVRDRIELVEGDVRGMSLDRKFSLVTVPYRAFLHMLTGEDQRRALKSIHRHLAGDGKMVLNVFDPLLEIITSHATPLGGALKRISEFTHPDTGRRVVVWDTRTYDPERQMLDMYFVFEELDGEGTVARKWYNSLKLRYVHRYEMECLLELCGFRVEALYGDFRRGPFRYGTEQVWVARKA